MSDFTGLLPESPAQKNAWKSSLSPMPVCAPGDLVDEVLWERFPEHITPHMQGRSNSCAGHGGCHAMEQAIFSQTGLKISLSPWFSYITGQKYGGNLGSDSGAYLGGIHKALTEVGICENGLAPNIGRYYTNIKTEAYENAKQNLAVRTIDLERGGYDDLRLLLGQQLGSAVFAVGWSIRFDSDGDVSRYIPGSAGHAMCWLALSSRKDSEGRPWVWACNSHETHTRYRMSPTAVEEVIRRDDWGAFGVSSVSTPVPKMDWRKSQMMA